MADSSFTSRRRFIQAITLVPAAAGLSVTGLVGCQSPSATEAVAATHFEPSYFTEVEWTFVQAVVDRLIPADADGPGALELGAAEFIDRQMQSDYGHGALWYMQGPFLPNVAPTLGYQLRFTPRELYRHGIAGVNAWCEKQFGQHFHALEAARQDEVLAQLEAGTPAIGDVPAKLFFSTLLQHTKEGYFADPIHGGNKGMGAWKMIGFPGARADFMDWAEQPGKHYPLGPVGIRGSRA